LSFPSIVYGQGHNLHIPVGTPINGNTFSSLYTVEKPIGALGYGGNRVVLSTRALPAIDFGRGVDYPTGSTIGLGKDFVRLDAARVGHGGGTEAERGETGHDESGELHNDGYLGKLLFLSGFQGVKVTRLASYT
jgi:hypothetical protein